MVNLVSVVLGGSVLLALAVLIFRFAQPEIKAVACWMGAFKIECSQTKNDASSIDITSLVLAIQDGLTQVQDRNIGTKRPEMFFIDTLNLELLFQVEASGDGSVKLVVLPVEANLESKETKSQKLTLEFSTIIDKSIRDYLVETCKGKEIIDTRATVYCAALAFENQSVSGKPTTQSEVEVQTDLLNLDWSKFQSEYKLNPEQSGSMGWGGAYDPEVSEELCKFYGVCAGTPISKYSFDPKVNGITSFEFTPLDSNKIKQNVNRTDVPKVLKDWKVLTLPDGVLKVSPPSFK